MASVSPVNASPVRRVQAPTLIPHSEGAAAAILWDLDFRVTSWSPGAKALLGYDAAEVIGRGGFELLGLARSKAAVADLRLALEERRSGFRMVSRARTKSGRTISCEWYHAPVFDPRGSLTGI